MASLPDNYRVDSVKDCKFPAGVRVLVVDHDFTWLKIVEQMLTRCNYLGEAGPHFFLIVSSLIHIFYPIDFSCNYELSCVANLMITREFVMFLKWVYKY